MLRYALPSISPRFVPVWRRNFLVWKKLAVASVLGNLVDPLIMLFGLGYGLGSVMSGGSASYLSFLAAGFVASATMYAASFEAMYSAFSRMHGQKTWDAILNAPMDLDDVVTGELAWAASKALLSGVAILVVAVLFGYAPVMGAIAAVPAALLIGLTFAALALTMNALAQGYDFFSYYMTLVLTPMMMLSGVFFPVEQLPGGVQIVAAVLPLYHGVALVRPIVGGEMPADWLLHAGVLIGYASAGFYAAVVLTRRRLLS
jgi:lipooligosaccharide transport system permease protein